MGAYINCIMPIQERRRNKSRWISTIIMGALLCFGIWNSTRKGEGSFISFKLDLGGVISVLIAEFRNELDNLLICEEFYPITTRCNKSKFAALWACFPQPNYCLGMVLILMVNIFLAKNLVMNLGMFIFMIILTPLASYITGLRSSTPSAIYDDNESEGKNLADGLAWSYYTGYLKLILPQIERTINLTTENNLIQDRQVFIVIPKNCQCHSSFSEVDPHVEFFVKTFPLKINRGGIQKRVYENNVYRIKSSSGKVYYCIMEYATPLMCLYDMAKIENSGLDAKDKEKQVLLFVEKLRKILESDPDCSGKYHLVFLSDTHEHLADTMEREITSARTRAHVGV